MLLSFSKEALLIKVRRYHPSDKQNWDAFIDRSKNATFLLKRDFIEYHADRYDDFSLIFTDEKTVNPSHRCDQTFLSLPLSLHNSLTNSSSNIIALLPASRHGNEIWSHGGLSYGGVISDRKMTMQKMLEIFEAIKQYLKSQNIEKLLYKRIPSIYYTYPSDEDLYALFRVDAQLIRRDVSTSIYLKDKIPFSSRRRRNIKKAKNSGLEIQESSDFQSYVDILTDVLRKHQAKPVHTEQELVLLTQRFPKSIKLFASFKDRKMLAGVLIFETPCTIHAQYIANSEEGRLTGALDLIFDYLINDYALKKEKLYFDFGISNENDGKFLNEGLITQKQEFGGRAIVHDFYEWKISP